MDSTETDSPIGSTACIETALEIAQGYESSKANVTEKSLDDVAEHGDVGAVNGGFVLSDESKDGDADLLDESFPEDCTEQDGVLEGRKYMRSDGNVFDKPPDQAESFIRKRDEINDVENNGDSMIDTGRVSGSEDVSGQFNDQKRGDCSIVDGDDAIKHNGLCGNDYDGVDGTNMCGDLDDVIKGNEETPGKDYTKSGVVHDIYATKELRSVDTTEDVDIAGDSEMATTVSQNSIDYVGRCEDEEETGSAADETRMDKTETGSDMAEIGSVISETGSLLPETGSVLTKLGSGGSETRLDITTTGTVLAQIEPVLSEAEPVLSEAEPVLSEAVSALSEPGSVLSEAVSALSEPGSVLSEAVSALFEPGSVLSEAVSALFETGSVLQETGPVVQESKQNVLDEEINPKEKDKDNVAIAGDELDTASTSGTQPTDQGHNRPTRYKCLKCCRVMKDKRLIENHSCDGEVDEEKVKITIMLDKDKKSFLCKECDYSSSGHSFEEHLMCHLMVRPYQCLYCKECFINRKEISRHVLKTHDGAKMSCALRALRKAKALIKEVTSSGLISFMAKVAGKVPLEKDPDKKTTPEGDVEGQDVTELGHSDQSIKEPHPAGQNMTEAHPTGHNSTRSDQSTDNSISDRAVRTSEEGKAVLENQQSHEEFSRLRKALTSRSSEPIANSNKNDLTADVSKAENNCDSSKSDDDSGLKIVASFTLQGIDQQEEGTEKVNDENVEQLNFIMSPPVEKEKDAEVLSFLGPETPVFNTYDSSCTPMLPPPPLQHAPFNSPGSMSQTRTLGSKQSEKNSNFFVCGFQCFFSSMSTTDFREHTVNFHSSETYFPCYYCGHRSPNETDLVRHISNHTHTHVSSSPLYVCGNAGCRFGSNMVVDYINHIKASHPDIPEPMCYSCTSTFAEPSMLQAHVEDNVIHIVNCPHCSSKATDRKAILNHISAAHPGKPKMVSVAKQLICHDRKVNNYEQMAHLREMQPPSLTPAPMFATSSVIDHIISRHDLPGENTKSSGSSSLADIPTSRSSLSSRDMPTPTSKEMSQTARDKEATPERGKSPASESSDFDSVKVKEEMVEDPDGDSGEGNEDARSAYVLDENGIRRRVYVPMSERRAENYRCKHCTFIARDFKRMHCHERSHGMPPTRKERFKCMFCPQGFDSEMKFRLHITCHPGLIKFLLYRCKKCEFDTNQKHTIVRHITCNRDRKHRGFGPLEDQYTVVSRSLESRVLECERCDYMTRHKIHMAIHYQRKHNILRDKGEFIIESILPTDTPLSSYGASPHETPTSPSLYNNFQSPESSNDDSFDFTKPSGTVKKSKDKINLDNPALTVTQITERNELFSRMVSQQAALQPEHVLENQMRKFKCPICQYLLPKAADLKNHVKRHSEIGQITLVMFRCKYCSCMSTARELLYEHLAEKHPGKPIALVKKIVAIDTTEVDKSFAETSLEESLDQLEESLHQEIMSNLNPGSSLSSDVLLSSSYEQLFVIPEGGEIFTVPLQCPKCSYSSSSKSEIMQHVCSLHPEVRVIGSDEDVDKLARATSEGIQQATKPSKSSQDSQEEVLILPDDQVFSEPSLCSRCDFTTMLRREMVIHLQQNHPEISVMGRNSYPVQVSAMGHLAGPIDDSCVVGSGSLDAKLRCLYENYGTQMKCLICGAERPKKFFIHVHILRHLNIYLWKCAFCAHKGLQKYKMVDHIKKIHAGKPLSVRYFRVNVDDKVAHFLSQFNVIKNRKASLDEGNYVPFSSFPDELSDQASNDSIKSRQKSPGPGGSTSSSCPHSLGSDELEDKISCMYESGEGALFRCKVCPNQFQRRFAMHRHIIISHLKVALLSCAYCGMEGVERHQLVDHILACHKPAPISILTLDIDLKKMALDFLAKVAAKRQGGLFSSGHTEKSDMTRAMSFSDSAAACQSEEEFDQDLPYFSDTKKQRLDSLMPGKSLKPPSFRFGNKSFGATSAKKTSMVDPDVIMLGRNALDKKLSCLYQERPNGQLRCLVCRWEFPRKYPLHRHIMLRHLKMSLVGCPYCPFEGIEKYNVSTHIKEEHKDKPINIKFTQPDVEARVREFVDDMANIGGKCQEDLIRKPKSKSQCLLVVPKVERQSDEEEENDDYENDNDGDDEEASSHRSSHGGLIVAMFGKKKQSKPNEEFVVKTEVDDDGDNDFDEGSSLNQNNDEGDDDDYNEDEDPGADKSSYEPSSSISKSSSLKYPPVNSYTPGVYRSPAGGKAKALDVTTKIKVLKSKEGPIMKFYCEKCKFTSLHRSNIVRHIYKIHEKYQTHTCPMCSYQTLSLMLMQKHTEKAHHSGQRKENSFTPNSTLSKSIMGPLAVRKKKQSIFSKKSESKSPSSGTGPKHFACAYCYYETDTQEDILKHTRDNHSQGDYHSSGAKSPAASELLVPKAEDRLSACWDGSKKAVKRKIQGEDETGIFKRKRRFIFEKGNELIFCGHCDTKETSMPRIQDHITWDHPGLPFKAKQVPAWRFLCQSCAVKTMATSKMKYHLNRHINYRPYTCVTCGAFFPSPDQCRRHSRSQAHEEQYTYVRNPKKESRVEELLEGTRQLALKVQDEAAKCPDFDISQTESFIARFQEYRGNLKGSLTPGGSKKAKKAAAKKSRDEAAGAEDEQSKKQSGKSPQTLGVEQDITIKCYNCEFTGSNVNSINIHHKQAHPGQKLLWTELDRGFTCDSTGEALVDCDSVPGTSMDVGYTTRMTIGSGNNTMRFKCKTCDFSSYVIQAMKSHLKSHQPKGFICPYCSRSFSGKEKLMRHQYCLHKGQALWVIHLRRSGVTGSTYVKKRRGSSTAEGSTVAVKEEVTSQTEDSLEKEEDSSEKSPKRTSQAQTTFLCSECSYTSESLYHFRLHLAQEHVEFRPKIPDSSLDSQPKFGDQTSLPESDTDPCINNFQCGYCNYTASDRSAVQHHSTSDHESQDPKILESATKDNTKDLDRKDLPFLLNFKPNVSVQRIPESVLNQYGYPESEDAESDSEEEDDVDKVESASLPDGQGTEEPMSTSDTQGQNGDRYDENRLPLAGEVSKLDEAENEAVSETGKFTDRDNEKREDSAGDSFHSSPNLTTDSDELARELGLVEDETSCVLGSETDMMILQFGGIVGDKGSDLLDVNINEESEDDMDHDGNVDLKTSEVPSTSSVFCSKDTTLFAAQEKDGQEDDDVVTFDNDIMLASPLPMISLGDGVSISLVNMENQDDDNINDGQDDDDNSIDIGNCTAVVDIDTNSEIFLDL